MRLPRSLFDVTAAEEYSHEEGLWLHGLKEHILLEIECDEEPAFGAEIEQVGIPEVFSDRPDDLARRQCPGD